MFDKEKIREAAKGREIEILVHIGGIPEDVLDGKNHPCPKEGCGGKDRFSLLDVGRGAVLCRQCFSQGNGDFFSAIQWMTGCTFSEAVKRTAEFLGVSKSEPWRQLWESASAGPQARSSIKPYLTARGLAGDVPHGFRFSHRCRHDRKDEAGKRVVTWWPAIIAPVSGPDGQQVAVHRIYLDHNRKAKAPVEEPKKLWGTPGSGAVRLGEPAGDTLAITEGIETGLAIQESTGVTTWAAISASQLPKVKLPAGVTKVFIFADHDPVGIKDAHEAATQWVREGRTVYLVIPPTERQDWLDVLNDPSQGADAIRRAKEESAQHPFQPTAAAPPSPSASDARATVILSPDVKKVNDDILKSLCSHPNLYYRGEQLCRIIRGENIAGVQFPDELPRIAQLREETLQEMMSETAVFLRKQGDEEFKPTLPPMSSCKAILARAEYPEIRRLAGIVNHPVLRADGSVATKPGYDPSTGLFLAVDPSKFPAFQSSVCREDAVVAGRVLFDLVDEFPFVDGHRSAWLAMLLTVLVRHLIDEPVPMFVFDANLPGTGKTKLPDLVSAIATGCELPKKTWPEGKEPGEEVRKVLTSIALAAPQILLFDNVVGRLGCSALDAILTSKSWSDRGLKTNDIYTLPWNTILSATGNNVEIVGDLGRRVILCRLESPVEKPQERVFKIKNILAHAHSHRGELLAAATTILQGFIQAGRPRGELSSFGSFDEWSNLIRGAIIWIGEPDPYQVSRELVGELDAEAQVQKVIIEGLFEITKKRKEDKNDKRPHWFGTSDILVKAFKLNDETRPTKADFQAAIREFCESGDENPDSRVLGNRLKALKGKMSGTLMFDKAKDGGAGVAGWTVLDRSVRQSPVVISDSSDSSDSSSGSPTRDQAGIHRHDAPFTSARMSEPERESRESPESLAYSEMF